jgi:polyphosphate kinase
MWYFENGGAGEYYMGSADWMPRNFDRRVEACTPVEDPLLHERLRSLFATYLADNRQAWELRPDGQWTQRSPEGQERPSHQILLVDSWGMSPASEGRATPSGMLAVSE